MAGSAGIAGLFLALTLGPMIDDGLKNKRHIAIELGAGGVNPQAGDSNGIPGLYDVPNSDTKTAGRVPGFAVFDIHGNNLGRYTPLTGENSDTLNPGSPGEVINIDTGNSPPPRYLIASAEYWDSTICLAWINTI